jgi:lysophospholipase L1-like esterase
MGGSTTEFKDKNGRDWPGLVEKELKEKYNFQNVKVYNIGKAWYTTLHMLINYEENLRKFKPDLLIVMENINDAWHNADFSRFSNGSFREDYGHYLGPEAFMLKSSSIFSYLSHFFNLLWYSDNIEIINTNNFPGIVPFGRNLKTIIALAKMDSTQVVLMTQPNLYKDKEEPTEYKALGMLLKEAVSSTKRWSYFTALSALRQYNNKIKEVADKEHVHLIDLEKEVPKSLEYFYDDVHYQEKTYDLIADYISQQIAPIIVETKKN